MGVLSLMVVSTMRGWRRIEGLTGCHASSHMGFVGRKWRIVPFHVMPGSFQISNLLTVVKMIVIVPCIVAGLLINWAGPVSRLY